MRVFHFRPYTLHLGRYELSRGAMMLPLPRIAMEILILLVERRGDLLTRQEIAARVWPGSDPEDVFQSINTAVNRIRSTLRDEATSPKYVQTVIGKGYRFMAVVEEMDLADEVAASSPLALKELVRVDAAHSEPLNYGVQLAASVEAVPVAAATPRVQLEDLFSRAAGATGAATLALPLQRRRLSPWVVIALVAVLAVTTAGAFALWHRFADASMEHRGAFKLTQLTTNSTDEPVTAGAISPDGKLIAYADLHGVQLRELAGAVRALQTPGLVEINRIEWFPDGRHLVVSGTAATTHTPQIWSLAINSDAPRLLHDRGALGVPSPDGSQIAFTTTTDTGITTFWTSDASGSNEMRVDVAKQGDAFPVLLWSADARKLILEEVSAPSPATNLKPQENSKEGSATHRLIVIDIRDHVETAALDGIEFSAACRWGKSGILFAGVLKDSRYTGLWRVNLDPETGTPLAAPLQMQVVENILALSRTADGRKIAAIFTNQQPDVYVAKLTQPGPRLTDVKRITVNTSQNYPQAWSSDSKSVLFESNTSIRAGTGFHLYRQAIDHPSLAEPIVPDARVQVLPQQSPDGKWILFASKSRWLSGEPYVLNRVPTAGGTPVNVDIGGPLDEYRCPISGTSCVLRETEGHTAFLYYALDPVAGKGKLLCSTPWTKSLLWDWSVSPDGEQIALPVLDPERPRIRVVSCTGSNMAAGMHEVTVRIAQPLMEVAWAADALGWFVSAAAPNGTDLFYVRLDGSATFLRHDRLLWGVPSPDGQKLAFVGTTIDSNVWLLH